MKVNELFSLALYMPISRTGDYFLYILVVVCHKGSVVSKQGCPSQLSFNTLWVELVKATRQVCRKCFWYPLGGISEGIRQVCRKKFKNIVGGQNTAI